MGSQDRFQVNSNRESFGGGNRQPTTGLNANRTESITDYKLEDLPWLTAGSCRAGMRGKPPGQQGEELDQMVDEIPVPAIVLQWLNFPLDFTSN